MSPGDTEWTAESVSAVSSMQSIALWCTPTSPTCNQAELREEASGGRIGARDGEEGKAERRAAYLMHCLCIARNFFTLKSVSTKFTRVDDLDVLHLCRLSLKSALVVEHCQVSNKTECIYLTVHTNSDNAEDSTPSYLWVSCNKPLCQPCPCVEHSPDNSG